MTLVQNGDPELGVIIRRPVVPNRLATITHAFASAEGPTQEKMDTCLRMALSTF
jgi:hypothetical protein